MRPSHVKALAASVLTIALASSAFAAAPQPSISGPGGSPGIGHELNFTIMNICPGPISAGWGVYGLVGWQLAQGFTPTVTAVPLGLQIPLSANGFTSCTITVAVYTDAGGSVPGTLLFISPPHTINGLPTYPSALPTRIKFDLSATTLTAGTPYVLLFETTSNACFVDATLGNTCPGGDALQSLDFGLTWTNVNSDVCRAVVGP